MAERTADDYIADLDGWQAEAAKKLRDIVRSTVPEVNEAVKWGQPTFAYHGQLCYFKAFKNHINFGFVRGADLEDPAGLLEGTGAKMRHVKIGSLSDIKESELKALLQSAAELNRAQSPDQA